MEHDESKPIPNPLPHHTTGKFRVQTGHQTVLQSCCTVLCANTFCNWDKYILQLGQIHFAIGTNTVCNVGKYFFEIGTYTVCNPQTCITVHHCAVCATLTSYERPRHWQINFGAHTPGFHLPNGQMAKWQMATPITLKSKSPCNVVHG